MLNIQLLNLRLLKEMLIKLDNCAYEDKKQYREMTKEYIKKSIESSCDGFLVNNIKIYRDGCYGFSVFNSEDKYLKIQYIAHNDSCKICYNGIFSINFKY